MTQTTNYDRRKFIENALACSAILFISRNVSVAADMEAINSQENLIMNRQTIEQSIEQYIRAWNEKGLKNIEAMLEKCWTVGGAYTDPRYPPMQWTNRLARVIQDSQEQMPDRRIVQTSQVDVHHNSGRYKWELVKKNGDRSEGLDYFEFDSDNRISRVVSFFGVLS